MCITAPAPACRVTPGWFTVNSCITADKQVTTCVLFTGNIAAAGPDCSADEQFRRVYTKEGNTIEVDMPQVRVLVSGQVQGVGYRYFVRDQALDQGISGWVRNNRDGTVSVAAEGGKERLSVFLERIRAREDILIRVTGIEVTWSDREEDFSGFEIRRY
jgi:acylphosphatase